MRPIGFSTGAVAYADFDRAIDLLRCEPITCIELSALRYQEVQPLIDAIGRLNLDRYSYVSFHAPSSFGPEQEEGLANQLWACLPRHWPIVLHPDAIHNHGLWRRFGSQLAIENMDQRKPSGRTVEELAAVFDILPEASLCFDIGHARQCDTSMTEAYKILRFFQLKLAQIHVSEVNTSSQHDPISYATQISFQEVSGLIPLNTPLIIESRVSPDAISREISRVIEALPEPAAVPAPAQYFCQPYA